MVKLHVQFVEVVQGSCADRIICAIPKHMLSGKLSHLVDARFLHTVLAKIFFVQQCTSFRQRTFLAFKRHRFLVCCLLVSEMVFTAKLQTKADVLVNVAAL